jgi:hypothetical protein
MSCQLYSDIIAFIYSFCSYVIEKLIERIKDRSLRVLPLCELDAEAKASMQHEAQDSSSLKEQ